MKLSGLKIKFCQSVSKETSPKIVRYCNEVFKKQTNFQVESLAVTWNIESHASASCPDVFGAIQFPTEEANVAKYFVLHYRYTKWHAGYPGKRSVSGFAVPSGFGESVCSVSGDQGFVVGGYSG